MRRFIADRCTHWRQRVTSRVRNGGFGENEVPMKTTFEARVKIVW
jgi:hypothetical protein